MGSILRLEDASGVEVGYLPRVFERAVSDGSFLRGLTDDAVRSFLLRAESEASPLTPKSVVLQALQAIETHLRAKASREREHPDFDDVVVLETRDSESVFRALVRTGFPKNARDWRDYSPYAKTRAPIADVRGAASSALVGPHLPSADAPWTALDQTTSRGEALHRLGPLDASSGTLKLQGHVERFELGKGTWYEAKEQPITVRFVSIFEQRWRLLLTAVEKSRSSQLRWRSW